MSIAVPHRQLFIGGEWREPILGKLIPIINPATEATIRDIPAATEEDVNLVVEAARIELKRNGGKEWARATGAFRAKYIRAIAAKAQKEELQVDLSKARKGKPTLKQKKNLSPDFIVKQGMIHSRGELLLMLDADGATKVTDLEKLESQIHALAEKKEKLSSQATTLIDSRHKLSDMEIAVFGSRAHLEKEALATRKWYRNFLMKGFHLVVLMAAGPGIRDTQCGFKMFTRAAACKLFTNIRLKRWCFDVEIVYLCKHLKIPLIEVSVNWSEIPGSKVRLTSVVHMLFELVLIRLGYGLGIWKIYT